MIPDTIHQIWIGDDPPPVVEHCMETVRARHPKWEYTLHDIEADTYLEHAAFNSIRKDLRHFYYEVLPTTSRPLAYKSDLLRLAILYVEGGVYLDSDMYAFTDLDPFRNVNILLGEMNGGALITEAIIGANPGSPMIFALLRQFIQKEPIVCERDGETTSTIAIGLKQFIQSFNVKVYPDYYFVPHRRRCKAEQRYHHTDDTVMTHLFWKDFDYDLDTLAAIGEVKRL